MKKYIAHIILSLLLLLAAILILVPQDESIQLLKKMVEHTGKLSFTIDIPVRYVPGKEMEKYLAKLLDEDYPAELTEKDTWLIRLMGFDYKIGRQSKGEITLKEDKQKLLSRTAAGIYNEKKGEILVLAGSGEMTVMESYFLAHELRHGLQDQYFGISSLYDARPDSDFDDRRIALTAALEGDATFLMVRFSELDPHNTAMEDFSVDSMMSFFNIGTQIRAANAPTLLKHQMLMPYLEGLKFVNFLYLRSKWRAVNKILLNPPVSTEQVLHPDKYLSGENPLPVEIDYRPTGNTEITETTETTRTTGNIDIPESTESIDNENSENSDGGKNSVSEKSTSSYSLYHSGVIGEYYLNVLLGTALASDYGDPGSHAVGWGGDRFEIYRESSGKFFFIWESVWDQQTFCSQFYEAFKKFIRDKWAVPFREGQKSRMNFIAGQATTAFGDSSSVDYFFLYKFENKLFYVRSNDRNQINRFINGGLYD